MLAGVTYLDVSSFNPPLLVDGVVSETGEGDMLMGKIVLTNACHKLDACCVCRYSIFPAIVLADRLLSE